MRLTLLCVFMLLALIGCKDQEGSNDRIPETKIVEQARDQAATSADESAVNANGKSWESRELEKHGLSKDSTVSDILNNKNKPKIDEIINWDQ